MDDSTSMAHILEQAGLLHIGSFGESETMSRYLTYQTAAEFAGAPGGNIFLMAHTMDKTAPLHTHDYYEISYVMDGTLLNKVGGKKLYMVSGSLCIMNLNSTHELDVVDPQAVLVNIGLRKELFTEGVFKDFLADNNVVSKFLRGETQHDYLFFYTESRSGPLSNSVVRMVEDYAQAGFKESFTIDAEVLLLLDTLSRMPSHSFYGIDRKALEMIEYIRDNCATVTASSLAQEFGYSENYCSQYVRRHTGKTISTLIADARIDRAEELLQTTDMSIEAIANAVGYKSVSHFHEKFKERHGFTPADYRKLGRAFSQME